MGTFRGLFEGFSNHVQHQLGIRKELMKIGRFTGQPENFFTYTVENYVLHFRNWLEFSSKYT